MPTVLADPQSNSATLGANAGSAAAEAPRQPFAAGETGGAMNRAGLALRIVVFAAAVLLAVAAQLSTREFDSGWVLALIAALAGVAALLALSLRHLGGFFGAIEKRWNAMLRRRASARADERFLSRAVHDPRLMAELQAALSRQPASDEASAALRARVEAAAGRI